MGLSDNQNRVLGLSLAGRCKSPAQRTGNKLMRRLLLTYGVEYVKYPFDDRREQLDKQIISILFVGIL